VHPTGDLQILVAEREPTDEQRHREAVVDAVTLEALLDLRAELARRLEDGRRLAVACGRDGTHDLVAQPEFGEGHSNEPLRGGRPRLRAPRLKATIGR